jgi:hypothetical protein
MKEIFSRENVLKIAVLIFTAGMLLSRLDTGLASIDKRLTRIEGIVDSLALYHLREQTQRNVR